MMIALQSDCAGKVSLPVEETMTRTSARTGAGGILRRIACALLLFSGIVAAAPAQAIDPPHDASNGYSCSTCHTGNSRGIPTSDFYNNVCLTCHRQGAPRSGKMPFSLADAANPFGTYSGVRPSKLYQTSHSWLGSDTVPAAGAQRPLNPALNSANALGSIACIRCHDVHGSRDTGPMPFLRMANDRDQMCLDCHRSRNTADHTIGTHPVNVNYSSTASKPGQFNNPPLNANPANPTSAMKLNGGAVLCTTCHGVHYADSDSSTIDGPDNYRSLKPSAGYLLRTDLHGADASSLNICSNCHKKSNHHGSKKQNVQCADCHGAHVDPGDGSKPNVYLLRRFINISTQYGAVRGRKVIFQNLSTKNYVDDAGTGVCQACHQVPAPGGIYPQEHSSHDAAVCNVCHTHDSASAFSPSAAGCTACHGQPPVANHAGGPDGYAGTYGTASGVDESKTPHARHAGGGSNYSFACVECHKGNSHASGTFQDVFKDPTGIIAATAGISPSYNSGSRSCSSVYCHSDGGPRNSSQVAVVTTKAIPGWVNGKGAITGCGSCHDAVPATNAHARHLAQGYACSVCHAATVAADGTIGDRTKHVNGVKDVFFATGSPAAGTVWNTATGGCSAGGCHSGGAPGSQAVKSPVWTDSTTGGCGSCHPVSPAIASGSGTIGSGSHRTHLASAYGPAAYLGASLSACQTCHIYASAQPDPRHVNGMVDLVSGAGSACAGCHPGTIPAWGSGRIDCTVCHGATPSTLPNGVAAPSKLNFAVTGHGSFGLSCTGCHDPNSRHITGTLGSTARLYGANDNTLCSGCHNGNTAPSMSTHVKDKNATPTPDLCKDCHDVHGTSNLHMIRSVINGQTIVFTNSSTGFIKQAAPYDGLCQVCHTQTNHYRHGVAPDGHPTKNCLNCHNHNASVAFLPTGGGACDSCHGYPPAPAGFKGTHGNYSSARTEDYAGGAGAHLIARHIAPTAKPSDGWVNCTVCHGNGSLSPSTHTMVTPVTPSKVTIDPDDRYKFNNGVNLGPPQYTGILSDGGNNATGSCFNVRCHFKPSAKWSSER